MLSSPLLSSHSQARFGPWSSLLPPLLSSSKAKQSQIKLNCYDGNLLGQNHIVSCKKESSTIKFFWSAQELAQYISPIRDLITELKLRNIVTQMDFPETEPGRQSSLRKTWLFLTTTYWEIIECQIQQLPVKIKNLLAQIEIYWVAGIPAWLLSIIVMLTGES